MKKFLSFLLTFVMLFSLTMPAMAAEVTGNQSGEVSASYTPTATITGVTITVDDVTYTGGNVTIYSDSTVTLTVHGTNLQYATFDNVVVYGTYVATNIGTDSGFTVTDDGKAATKEFDASAFVGHLHSSMYYCNDYTNDHTLISTDITTSYDEGTKPVKTAQITGVTLTVDGTPCTSGNVAIYSDSTVTLTVTGTNLQYGTEDNYVHYAQGVGVPVTTSYFDFSDDGTSATYSPLLSSFSTSNNFEITYYNDYTDAENRTKIQTGISVTYSGGISEEDKAVITGVSITVDGNQYTSGNVTIYSDSEVTLTVTGTNLQNGTSNNNVSYAFGNGVFVTPSYFKFTDDGTTATKTYSGSDFANCEDFQIKYCNNHDDDAANRITVPTGIYLTYDSGTKPTTYDVNISETTNGSIESDKQTAAEGDTVTLNVAPSANYRIETVTVKDANGDTVNFTNTGVASGVYTFTMPASNVTVTATFTAISTTTVEITWGSMSFTYSDEQVTQEDGSTADKGWDDSDTGWVTVKNTGDTTFTAQAKYESYEDYTEITGSFDPVSYELVAESSYTFNLELSGTPAKALSGDKIGKVTITITETPAASTIVFTIDGEVYTAEEGMTWAEWAESEYNTAGLVVNGNAIWDSEGFRFLTNVSEGVNVGSDSVIAEDTDYSWAFSL